MDTSLEYIKSRIGNFVPELVIVLGSGLGSFTDGMEGISVPYSDIEGFGSSNVKGHKGSLFFTRIKNKNVAIMQGRFHYYEGNSLQVATYPIKVLRKLGANSIILTNAAGALDLSYRVGDIMLIEDHINFMGQNPLIGKNDDSLGERFPDMSDVYSKEFIDLAFSCARKENIEVQKGVYAATTGPSYETKAEVRMLKMLGADVVGMSTVPEAIVANWCSMKVLGISLVTNYASGVSNNKLSHGEVIEAGRLAGEKIKKLLLSVIENI